MQEFRSINGVDFGNKVYIFATKFFLVKKKERNVGNNGKYRKKILLVKINV
jgi:hypothetical protein